MMFGNVSRGRGSLGGRVAEIRQCRVKVALRGRGWAREAGVSTRWLNRPGDDVLARMRRSERGSLWSSLLRLCGFQKFPADIEISPDFYVHVFLSCRADSSAPRRPRPGGVGEARHGRGLDGCVPLGLSTFSKDRFNHPFSGGMTPWSSVRVGCWCFTEGHVLSKVRLLHTVPLSASRRACQRQHQHFVRDAMKQAMWR